MAFLDYKEAVEYCRFGLLANPNDAMILNNLTVSLAYLDQLEDASTTFKRACKAEHGTDMDFALIATGGLLLFRSGDFAHGRRAYLEAIERARNGGRPSKNSARAAIILAMEEIRAGTEEVAAAVGRAIGEAAGRNEPDVVLTFSRLEQAARGREDLSSITFPPMLGDQIHG
jgi:tetratricopeptide (TPR) repeat protein